MNQPSDDHVISIGCDGCVMDGTSACDDCLVTFLCDPGPTAVVLDLSEYRAIRSLQRAGLAPEHRHSALSSSG